MYNFEEVVKLSKFVSKIVNVARTEKEMRKELEKEYMYNSSTNHTKSVTLTKRFNVNLAFTKV